MVMNPPAQIGERTGSIKARLVDFCQQHPPCFVGWPPSLIEEYLEHHLAQQTMSYTTDGDNHVTGMGVAWQAAEEEILSRDQNRKPFDWQPTNPAGDCIVIAQLISTTPQALCALISACCKRWPKWRSMKLYAGRRGKLVRYQPQRLFNKLFRHGYRQAT